MHIGVINDGTSASNSVTQSAITTGTVLTANIPNTTNATLRVQQVAALSSGATRALDVYAALASVTGVRAGQAMLVAGGSRFGGSGDGGLGMQAYGGSMLLGGTGAGGDAIAANGGNGATGAGGDGVVAVGGDGTSGGIGVSARGGNAGPGGTAGIGVRGASTSSYGIYGLSQSGPGVFGGSNSSIGVYANSNEATAVFASTPRTAVWGRSAAGTGVFGQATGTGASAGFGVYGAANAPGWAGYFEGNVYVTGQLIQAGAAASTATATDGTTRTLYSQDNTEPVIEDFGEEKLVGGKADVRLDPDFAAIADGGAYHVFLTEGGDYGGLYVPKKDPTVFEVRARNAGAGGPFSYRVVAKRKGAAGKRLERIERPKGLDAKELEPPKLPEAPTREPEKPTAGSEGRPGRPEGR